MGSMGGRYHHATSLSLFHEPSSHHRTTSSVFDASSSLSSVSASPTLGGPITSELVLYGANTIGIRHCLKNKTPIASWEVLDGNKE